MLADNIQHMTNINYTFTGSCRRTGRCQPADQLQAGSDPHATTTSGPATRPGLLPEQVDTRDSLPTIHSKYQPIDTTIEQ